MKIEVLGNTLDKQQTKAAMVNNKNTIIIAGAGSGKSLTMVGKIKYLVQVKKIKLNEILCITFTNNAAKSLEEKIRKELGLKTCVYTFHKLSLEILNEHHVKYKIADDSLLDYLIEEIFYAIAPTSYFEKYFLTKNYLYTKDFINYKKTISRFIRLFIGNYYELEILDKIIKRARKKDKSYLKIIKKIYEMYILEKKSSNLIDFDDMIFMATKLVHDKGIKTKYKYIIIDEYQDTSRIRENLVKEIINKTNAFITVVGDDFQSIYRFSGCDINNFLEFSDKFKPVKKLYLTSTYRNSQELIKVAGSFVMENNRQIKKQLISNKHIDKPIIICYYKNRINDFKKLLDLITSSNIMILGRNNKDIYDVLSKDVDFSNNQLIYKDKNIYYKTIHKAKGLEEDDIIIINLSNDTNSLPSKIKDQAILKYVLIHKDLFPFEEERRLFYVALTRTKNYCYLFVPKNNPSIFVEELVKKYKKYITIINL